MSLCLFLVIKPKGNYVYAVIKKWPKQRFVSWDVKLLGTVNSWANIFFFTIGGTGNTIGDRCPAFFHLNGQVQFYHNLGSQSMTTFFENKNIDLGVYHHFYYEQRLDPNLGNYVIKVTINGTIIASEVNTHPNDFENVEVYVSSKWHLNGNAIVKNLKFGAL